MLSCGASWALEQNPGLVRRCALLSKAALEAPWHVPCGGAPYGDNNLVFIANDWHTALLPIYLQARWAAVSPCQHAPHAAARMHACAHTACLAARTRCMTLLSSKPLPGASRSFPAIA